jgi:hypothetical protein
MICWCVNIVNLDCYYCILYVCMFVCFCSLCSEFYTTEASVFLIEMINSHFHLYGYGYHYNHIDEASLATGTLDAEDDSAAKYLEHHN